MKTRFCPGAFIVLAALASVTLLPASDLSVYREFHLGSSPADVAKQAGMESSETKLISSRPQRIEELDWKTNRSAPADSQSDSVKGIRFRFYNGGLFEMMVSYDRDHTSGLTDADMTQALSAIYGPANTPAAKEMSFNSDYNSTVRVIGQWHDAGSLLSLVGFSYGDGFGVIVSSNNSLALARTAMLESDRLDRVEAPQRALDLKAKLDARAAARDEKSRLVNKPGFRP
jgi:hypothetical protein